MLRPEEIESLSRTVTNKDEAEQVLSNFLPLVRGFPVKEFRSSRQMEHLPSKYILPDDWSEFSPVCSTGNGNCLFNSVSIVMRMRQSRFFRKSVSNARRSPGVCKCKFPTPW